jgi:hypothetical protein
MAAYFERVVELNERFRRARRSYLVVGAVVMGGMLAATIVLLISRNWALLGSVVLALIWLGALGDPIGNYALARQGKLIVLPIENMAIELATSSLIVSMGTTRLEVPLEDVKNGKFVSESSLEGRRGLSAALYLDVGAPQMLMVPEVADGFPELMKWLKATRYVEQEVVSISRRTARKLKP